jgi:ribonuclease D
MELISDSGALQAFCQRIAGSRFITVDTEFIRDRTFWPVLCLVQIAGEEEAGAIDAQANGIDLTPVFELMAAPTPLKVFHAARQDIEIFYHLTGRVPAPLFDTQIAAMVCGFGDSVAYETLASRLAKARIDKSMRFTDWSRRPLSPKQLAYAISDVTHLRIVYEKLAKRLADEKRETWVAEEMAVLTAPSTYEMDPREAWRRLKPRSGKPRFLAVLRELAAWREEEARRRNLPRSRVVRDETLKEIAAHDPKTVEDLTHLRSLGRGQAQGEMGRAILAAVERGHALPESECPEPIESNHGEQLNGASVELLRVLLKMKCERHHVAQKLVASAADIEALAESDAADVPALHGWRREVFGEDALALKHGKLGLTAEGNKVRMVKLGGP